MIEIILQIAQIIIGLAFFLYLPGYFLTELFLHRLDTYEKIVLSSVFSVMIGMAVAVFFGYDRAQAAWTGGFVADNIWIAELLLTSLFAFILVLQRLIIRHPFFENKNGRTIKRRRRITER